MIIILRTVKTSLKVIHKMKIAKQHLRSEKTYFKYALDVSFLFSSMHVHYLAVLPPLYMLCIVSSSALLSLDLFNKLTYLLTLFISGSLRLT